METNNLTCDFSHVMSGDIGSNAVIDWDAKCHEIDCKDKFEMIDFIHIFLC